MFSQACVKNSGPQGGGEVSASVHAGIHPRVDTPRPPTFGTHPTGMHSCFPNLLREERISWLSLRLVAVRKLLGIITVLNSS